MASVVVIALLLALSIGPVAARASKGQGGFTSFETSRLTKPKKVGVLHSVVEVPADVDQTRSPEYYCVLSAHNAAQNGQLANVRAVYRSEAYVVDHRTGGFEIHVLDSGTMKTTQLGFVRTVISIPEAVLTEIFTDGFESGDVTAFLVTRAKPTKGRRLVHTQLRCDLPGG